MDTKKFEDFVIGKLGYETTITPTQRDIDIVRYSWEKVVDLRLPEDEDSVSPAQAFGLAFYDALFELDPSVRSLFGTNVFTQAKMLSGVLAFITRVPFIKHQPNNNNNNNNNNDINNNNNNNNDINHDSNNYNSSDDDSILNEKPPSITKTYTIREINAMKREQEEKESKDNFHHHHHHHHQNYNINNHHHPCQFIEKESNNIVNSHHHHHHHHHPKNKVHNNDNINNHNHHQQHHHHHKNNNYSNKNPPISHSRSSSSRSISSKLKMNNNKKDDLDVDPDLLIEKLQDLGARHFYYNVKPEQFKLIGPAIDAALEKRLGDEYTKEVKDAWSITHAYAAHHMAVGLRSQQQYEKKKSNSLKNSSNNNCIIQ